MDVEEYVAARHGTLLRAAVLLGVPEEEAPQVVARVLGRSTRVIRRSTDPDPAVLDALVAAVPGAERTLLGSTRDDTERQRLIMQAPPVDPVTPPHAADLEPEARERTPWQLLPTLGALVALVAAAGIVGQQPPPAAPPAPGPSLRLPLTDAQVPSLFGYDAEAARALLVARGARVVIRTTRDCEINGRVVSSTPPLGAPFQRGDTVVVRAAVPADPACMVGFGARTRAWRFVDFASGRGPSPRLADTVEIIVDGGEPTVLSRRQGPYADRWGPVLDDLADAVSEVSIDDSSYVTPRLRVSTDVPPPATCGITRPLAEGERHATTLTVALPVTPTSAGQQGCPLSVSLYGSAQGIDTVVLYTAKATGAASEG